MLIKVYYNYGGNGAAWRTAEYLRCVMLVAVWAAVDRQLGTVKSGGVQLVDLHDTATPRRHAAHQSPTLESFHFIPYDEQSLAGRSVADYAETCVGFALERMRRLSLSTGEDGPLNLKLVRRLVSESSWSPAANETLTQYFSSPDAAALKTLENVFAVARDDGFAHNVNSVVSAAWSDIVSTDRLFGFARSDRCFKTCLDVVLENIPAGSGDDHINVVECDAGTGQAYPHVVRQLSLHPGISISYTATDPAPAQSIDAELAHKLGIDVVQWSLGSTKPVAGRASGADLVILANVLHRHDSISTALSAAVSLVSDGGFLLIVEATSNFAIPWSFFALTHDVSNMSDIGSRTCGPFCDEQTWSTLLTNAGLTTVARKSDGLLHTVFLCRKLTSTSLEQAPSRIIDVDDASFCWLEEVKAVMSDEWHESDSKHGSVWLRATTADSGVVGMQKCLRREPNGDCLR